MGHTLLHYFCQSMQSNHKEASDAPAASPEMLLPLLFLGYKSISMLLLESGTQQWPRLCKHAVLVLTWVLVSMLQYIHSDKGKHFQFTLSTCSLPHKPCDMCTQSWEESAVVDTLYTKKISHITKMSSIQACWPLPSNCSTISINLFINFNSLLVLNN